MTAFLDRLPDQLRRPSVSNAPPDPADIRRNDLATLAWFVFILILGWGIRNNALTAGNPVTLGDNLLQVTLPAGWIQGSPGDTLSGSAADAAAPLSAAVWNSRSAGLFDAAIEVRARRLRPGENLMTARAALSLQRSQELLRYRELQAETITVLHLVPGTRITHAYIADPTRATGASAPPVVVQGQDILFLYRDHLIHVAVAADAAAWDQEMQAFDLVFQSLRVREVLP